MNTKTISSAETITFKGYKDMEEFIVQEFEKKYNMPWRTKMLKTGEFTEFFYEKAKEWVRKCK